MHYVTLLFLEGAQCMSRFVKLYSQLVTRLSCYQSCVHNKCFTIDLVLTIRSVHCPSLGPTQRAQQPFRHFKCSALSKCWTHFMHGDPWTYCWPRGLSTAFPTGLAYLPIRAKGATKLMVDNQ